MDFGILFFVGVLPLTELRLTTDSCRFSRKNDDKKF